MAGVTATSFLLLGIALILARRQRAFTVGQYLVIVAGVLCLFNTTGLIYGIRSFYETTFRTGGTTMAI
jgi:hypothetical protein